MIGNQVKKTDDRKPATKVFVTRCKAFENEKGVTISFDAIFDDKFKVYGLRYIEGKKDGKEYAFVSMPSYKGKDGNYYKYCDIKITAELLQEITDQLVKRMKEE